MATPWAQAFKIVAALFLSTVIPTAASEAVPGLAGPATNAFASCAPEPSHFNGMQVSVNLLDAAKATISTATPYQCAGSGGNSYWVMVRGPGGGVCANGGYAQDGWLLNGGTPTVFVDTEGVNLCDNGPILYGSVSGTNNFTTQMRNIYGLYAANYYENGSLIATIDTDWGAGLTMVVATEVHDSTNKIGTVNYTGLQQCTFTGVHSGQSTCSPDTNQPSLNSQNALPINSNGCYFKTGTYSFETYGVNSSGQC